MISRLVLVSIFSLSNISLAGGKVLKTAMLGDRMLVLEGCELKEFAVKPDTAKNPDLKVVQEKQNSKKSLYKLDTQEDCRFMVGSNNILRVVETPHGKVVGIEIPKADKYGKCKSRFVTVTLKDSELLISRKYRERYPCGLNWYEKTWHVMAYDSMKLPSSASLTKGG